MEWCKIELLDECDGCMQSKNDDDDDEINRQIRDKQRAVYVRLGLCALQQRQHARDEAVLLRENDKFVPGVRTADARS